MSRLAARSPLLIAALLLAPSFASANGNVSHQWVTQAAAEQTPAEGSLRDLVGDEALREILHTGTMYPDWGYTPGASTEEREAGESSHWEPVQDGYRQWIMENYAPPWSDEARQHLAFYLGLSSHGMADQTYDAMFFERSRFFMPGDHSDFDQDTDVMWAATTGPGVPPKVWVPAAPLIDLFASLVGVTIVEADMTQQLGFVGVGISGVNLLAEDPAQVASAEADYPWAAMHDDDSAIPGNPPHEAEIVRRYWRSNWALLHGDAIPRSVLWTHPADGGANHAQDAASIESWISVVFARGLSAPTLAASQFHVLDSTGAEVPIEIDLFYGDESHVVHVKPLEDLASDEVYVVEVDAGVATIHGESLEGFSFTFSTGARGPTPLRDDGFWDEPDPYGDEPTGGSSSGGGADDTGGTTTASNGESGTTEGSAAVSTGTDGGPAGENEGGSGCGCASEPRPSPARWGVLGLLALGWRRKR